MTGAGGAIRELRPMTPEPGRRRGHARPIAALPRARPADRTGADLRRGRGPALPRPFAGRAAGACRPIDQERQALGEALAAQDYAASFFANDARPGVVLRPDHFKDESVKKEWLANFKRLFGGGNRRHSAMLLEYGMKLENLPVPNHTDLQFLELRKLKASEICAIYRVPPHKVAILERSTNNNIEHQGIEYVTDCLLTWCRRGRSASRRTC
jgi:HK97 family phage portal protein